MADIKMLLQNYVNQDDDQNDDDSYNKYYESSMLDQTNPDDLLSPLEKLRKYCTSENIFTRQMVARSIVETVQSISSKQECLSLLEIITKLSDDIEPSIRCELMEQLPPCSVMIVDMKIIPDVISTFILPIMVRYLSDANNQVRKLSQNALLQLMDQDLITKDDVESQICPVILVLTEPESSDDFRTEAVALMTKITCLLGSELTEKLFLDRFGRLCSDALFHVRKVCASNFGEMASVVQRETTEKQLLRLFAHLCQDGVWGVRKACAETFMGVSGLCVKSVRYQTLSPLFVGLLCDKSRWVQMAAYQALGQFIATFAEPEHSGFRVTEDGILVPYEGYQWKREQDIESDLSPEEDPSLESDRVVGNELSPTNGISNQFNPSSDMSDFTDETSKTFNNFEFWRMPLPSVEDLDLVLEDLEDSQESQNIVIQENEEVHKTMSLNGVDNVEENNVGDTEVKANGQEDNQEENGDAQTSLDENNCDITKTDNSNDNDFTDGVKTESLIQNGNGVASAENEVTDETATVNENQTDCLSLLNSGSDKEDVLQEQQQIEMFVEQFDNQQGELQSPFPERTIIQNGVSQDVSGNDGFGAVHDFYLQRSDEENSDDENPPMQNNPHYSAALISNLSLHTQKIVPPALLEHYISMTEPSKAHTIDGDLPRHCAFTLPGVVLALGRENWHLLRDTYIHLSTDMQWKVRRTLAFSIHDLAQILGQKICVEDLVHVFHQFLKDLDEVRVGVLKHLYDFISILPATQQKFYLPIFCEFQKTDNVRNWRFRKDLSEQLILLVELYNEEELGEYICPVALELASDKVADVRENSYNLVCILLRKLYEYEDQRLFHKFVLSIITLGTHHQHWVKRKACSQMYNKFLLLEWYDKAHFARDFLPSLLNLCADVVPNVRLIASKSLLSISRSEYYESLPEADEVRKHVDHTLETLQLDEDRDVRYFSGGKYEEKTTADNDSNADTIHLSEEESEHSYLADGKVEENLENITLEMALDDNVSFSYSHGVRIIQRGIHEYAINDDDDDDTELVEEVYIEDTRGNPDDGDVVMEEYYMDAGTASLENVHCTDSGEAFYIEEVIEEIIDSST